MEDSDVLLPSNNAREVMVDVYPNLRRFLIRRLGDKDEAADVLHDFYVKVLLRVGDVREKEKLRAWMFRVLETSLIDYYRAQSKKRQSEIAYCYLELASLDNDVEDDLDFIDCKCLYKLLPTLKPDYTEILWRAELIGEPRKTIAATLSISESNLRVRLHRAREALRKRLEETCQSCPIQLRWNGSLSANSSVASRH